jgi:simple sugar transport system permease protein
MTDTHGSSGSSPRHITHKANMALASLRRIAQPRLITILSSIALALLIGAGLIALLGVNPFRAYGALLDGAVGNKNSIAETLVRAIPLTLAGVGVSIAFRSSTFNVGAEGQLFLGGMASAWVALLFTNLPGPMLVPLMIVDSMLAGALWAVLWIPEDRATANRVHNTIMMNYIAFFRKLFTTRPQRPQFPMARTAAIPVQAKLFETRMPGTLARRLHHCCDCCGACLLPAVAHHMGFSATGNRKKLACSTKRRDQCKMGDLVVLMACGALAGLAGYAEVAGVQLRMIENLSPGYGYTAMVVHCSVTLIRPGAGGSDLIAA